MWIQFLTAYGIQSDLEYEIRMQLCHWQCKIINFEALSH